MNKPCPHCGKDINLKEFIPKRKTRFTGMTPEERKIEAAKMAGKRWAGKSSEALHTATKALEGI